MPCGRTGTLALYLLGTGLGRKALRCAAFSLAWVAIYTGPVVHSPVALGRGHMHRCSLPRQPESDISYPHGMNGLAKAYKLGRRAGILGR